MARPRILVVCLLAIAAAGLVYTFWASGYSPVPSMTPGPKNAAAPKHLDTFMVAAPTAAVQPHPQSSNEEPKHQQSGLCDQYFDTGKIAIIVRTGATEALAKLPTQLVTSLRCIKQPLLFSDLQQSLGGHVIYDVLANVSAEVMDRNEDFDLYRQQHELAASGREIDLSSLGKSPPSEGDQKGSEKTPAMALDKYKVLHMIELARHLRPDADWFVFIEADTYLSWPNLLSYLAGYDSSDKWYLGKPISIGDSATKTQSANGGPGFMLSGSVVRAWSDGWASTWDERIRDMPSIEYVLSVVLDEELQVQATAAAPMIGSEKLAVIPYGENDWCSPVVTLAQLDLRQLDNIYRTEIAMHRSPLLFKDLHAVHATGYPFKRENWDNKAGDADHAIEVVPNDMEKTKGQWEPKDLVDPHANVLSCELACIQNTACFQFTFTTVTHITNLEMTTACYLTKVFRMGEERKPENSRDGKALVTAWTSGWRSDRITRWIEEHQDCP